MKRKNLKRIIEQYPGEYQRQIFMSEHVQKLAATLFDNVIPNP
jgi:hypothetical protein